MARKSLPDNRKLSDYEDLPEVFIQVRAAWGNMLYLVWEEIQVVGCRVNLSLDFLYINFRREMNEFF